MTNQNKTRIPSHVGLKRKDIGNDVTELQEFLEKFGYLQREPKQDTFLAAVHEKTLPKAQKGTFDDATEMALRNFQNFYGLSESGQLDESTIKQMALPRCGFPDMQPSLARFREQGNKWPKTDLTYRFESFTPDLSEDEVRSSIAEAFKLWSDVTPLTFTEVEHNTDTDILIEFSKGEHGDGEPFDGVGNVLAHAYYPPPNNGDLAGDAHFDDSETWSVNIPSSGTDLVTVAAHEFGHSLGLAHSTVEGSLMFPSYSGPHRFLHQDDINGIQSIYGH